MTIEPGVTKLLILAEHSEGGIGQHIDNTAEALRADGYTVDKITEASLADLRQADEATWHEFLSYHAVPSRRPGQETPLALVIERGGPMNGAFIGSLPMRAWTPPAVSIVHNSPPRAHPPILPTSRGSLRAWIRWHRQEWTLRQIWSRLSGTIAVSEYVAASLRSDWSSRDHPIRVATAGINTSVFAPQSADAILSIRDRLRLDHGSFIVGFIGRLEIQMKGIDRVLRSVAAIPIEVARELNLCILFLGPHSDSAALEINTLASSLGLGGMVELRPPVDDPQTCWPAFDVAVFLSRYEGGPLTILEAMSCGIPVIATPVGFIPEVLNTGKGGYLVDGDDPQVIAEKIVGLASAGAVERKRIGRAGRERVAESFEAKSSYQRLARTVTALASSRYGSLPSDAAL